MWVRALTSNGNGKRQLPPTLPSRHFKLQISSEAFQRRLKLHLGLAQFSNPDSTCSECNDRMDALGIHATICKSGKTVIARHDLIRDEIIQICRDSGIQARCEQLHVIENSGERPGDAYLPQGFNLQPTCVDIAVANPLCQSSLRTSVRNPGSHLEKAYTAKLTKYQAKLSAANINLVPFIVDIFGAIHPESLKFLQKIASMSSIKFDKPWQELTRNFITRIQTVLVNSVSNQFLARSA